jgi:hypothetical protein
MLLLEFIAMYPASLVIEPWQLALDAPTWHVLGSLFSTAWLPPDEVNLYWMIPLAGALLLGPSLATRGSH